MGQTSGKNVLFFGQKDCEYSNKAYEFLVRLDCDITAVWSKNRGEKRPDDIGCWRGDYIFCFRSYYILPKMFIEQANIGAINIHPAPPEYPGSGCLNWALYEGTNVYGVTAHLMDEDVDHGDILKVKRFSIFENDNVQSLLERTHSQALTLFFDVINDLFKSNHQLSIFSDISKKEKWNGKARKIKEIDQMSIIEPGIERDELRRRIRAFHTTKFPLTINLNNQKFVLKTE